jgi:uncharacterized repeat protein (TIGR03837 family)
MASLQWDLFCRVIDNFGDVGVGWRLAAALACRGQTVRLWIDQPQALAWMAPHGAPGVEVIAWPAGPTDRLPGDVVVETFGCNPPADFVARMAAAQRKPVWINLEYLSAEAYVERSHGLPSPQFAGPGAGLKKWFYYPGFTPATGGLLHDCGAAAPAASAAEVPAARAGAQAWAQARGWAGVGPEQTVLVFCYPNPALPGLLQALAQRPTLLLLPPGAACHQVQALTLPQGMRALALPYLAQPDFDRLLAGTDLNLVRGEDSFARAQLCAASPFLWQIYPQHDGVHAAKLAAFLDLYLAGSPAPLAQAVGDAFRAFNGLAAGPIRLPERAHWQQLHARWRAKLLAQDDLCGQLLRFVAASLP